MADLSFWVGAGDYGGGNAHGAQVYGSAWESGTSVDGNYSTVSWSISATYTCRSGYTWGGSTRSSAGYLDMIVNGSVVGTITMSITKGWGNGTSIGSLSGSLNIGHAADGSGSFSFGIRVRTGDGNFSGDQAVYGRGSQSSSKGLSTIPRASQPSASTGDPTAGSAFTVYTNRKSSSFTHTIYYEVRYGGNNGAHIQVASGVAGSCTVTVPESVFNSIGSASTVPLRILCYTYSGSTQIGDVKYTDLTLHASSSMAPSISSFAITETNSSVSAKGSSITLRYLSRKVATCKATAKNGASISSVVVTNGSNSWAMPLTLSTYTSATMDMLASGHYVVTVTDSRGLKSQAEINQTYYSYSAPTVSGSASRASATGAAGSLTIKGTYWNQLSNTASITYQRNDASATKLSATASNGSVSGSVSYTDLDYQTIYRWTLTITDSFGESGSVTVTLPASVPSFWIGKTTIAINGVKLDDYVAGCLKVVPFSASISKTSGIKTVSVTVPNGYVLLIPAPLGAYVAGAESAYVTNRSATQTSATTVSVSCYTTAGAYDLTLYGWLLLVKGAYSTTPSTPSTPTTPTKYSIDNVVSYLQQPTLDAVKKVDALPDGTTSFIVLTDTHGAANKQHSQAVVRYILDNAKTVGKCFWLGDVSNQNFSSDEYVTFKTPLVDAKSQIYFALGNHDLAGISASDAYMLFYHDWLNDKPLHGKPGEMYYYFDDSTNKIRYIVLRTVEGGMDFQVVDDQLNWLKTAVKVPSADWGVAVFGHVDIDQSNVTGSWCVKNGNDVISAIKSTNGRVIGYFCGHEHVDQMRSIDGFHQTMFLCDRFDLDKYFADKGLKYPDKVAGQASEQTVTIVSINQTNRTVKFTRIGSAMVNGNEDYTY